MKRITDMKKKWMKEPEFRKEYEKLTPEFEITKALISARTKAGLTQLQLAKKMGTTQSVVARLEAGGTTPSLKTLLRYAKALHVKPQIKFVPLS